jgi:transcriptional regulator with XRE-family HTH domain
MLTTGNQLKAARALAGLSQSQLATESGLNVTTISAMEGKGAGTLGSGLDTIKAVMDALDAAGVEVLNHGRPGCRLKATRSRRRLRYFSPCCNHASAQWGYPDICA